MQIKKVCFLSLILIIILSFPVSTLAQKDDEPVDDPLYLAPKLTEFTQAANEDPTLGDIHWINSILQLTNSAYYEGMSVPQRIIFAGISSTPGDTHALTLSHEATKGGVHAYDFMTSWDNAIPAADSIASGQNLLVNLFSDRCDPDFWGMTQAVCNQIHSLGLYDEADLTVLDMGSVGGHNVEQRVDNYDTYFGIPRTVKIWGNDSVSSAYITFDSYTGSTDDKYANYTLHWTSASDTVIIEFAGHLAVSVDPLNAGIGYGEGFGAAAIAGGPYHFKLSYLDGASLGSQDNQIKGADILMPILECRVVPAADSVCAGGSATFIDSSRGGTQPYSWSWTGPNGFTASTQSITINNAQLVNAGTYQVIVTDNNGLKDTCQATLTVNPQPVCSISGGTLICEGSTTNFCAIAGMASYSWSGPGGFTASTKCTGPIGVAGEYTVIITDSSGCMDTCSRTLTLKDQPVCAITGDSAVCDGSTADFCATPGMASYSWSGPGGFTASTQCTGPIGVAGYYQVIIADAFGCADTCGRTLVVNTPPVCDITGDSVICEGSTTDFCATAGMASYSWSGPGGFTSSTQCAGPIGVAGYYQVIITDANGCADTCGRTLVLTDKPVCSITGDSTVCEGSTTDFCATAGMASYSWSGPGGFTASTQCTGPIAVAGYYEVIITATGGCADTCGRTLVVNTPPICSITGDSTICEGSTTDFCATPGMASYSWMGPGEFTASTQCTGPIDLEGYYEVVITDSSGCVDTCSRFLVVNTPPVCSITGDSTICEGSTADFCAIPGMASYSWSGPGGFIASTQCTGPIGVAGYYEVIITDVNGCADTCGRTLVLTDKPVCAITGGNTVCTGFTTNFCATPGMSSYSWSGPGGFTGSNQCTGPIGVAGGYTVIITDANGCADTCSRTLTVYALPVCQITGDNVIDKGATTEFCATPGMASYSWTGPGGFTASTQCTGPIADSGYYQVTIIDENGCTKTCSRKLSFSVPVSSMTPLGLVFLILVLAGIFGYLIFIRRKKTAA